jgi:hypothetical protein
MHCTKLEAAIKKGMEGMVMDYTTLGAKLPHALTRMEPKNSPTHELFVMSPSTLNGS